MSEERTYHPDTQALHAGYSPDPTTGSRAVPIYYTTAYSFQDTAHAARLFELKEFGNIYTRIMNPTTDVLEQRCAALEGGIAGLGLSAGSAAINYSILNIAEAGNNIVGGNADGSGQSFRLSDTGKHLVDVAESGDHERGQPPNALETYEGYKGPGNFVDHDPAGVGVVRRKRSRRPQ